MAIDLRNFIDGTNFSFCRRKLSITDPEVIGPHS